METSPPLKNGDQQPTGNYTHSVLDWNQHEINLFLGKRYYNCRNKTRFILRKLSESIKNQRCNMLSKVLHVLWLKTAWKPYLFWLFLYCFYSFLRQRNLFWLCNVSQPTYFQQCESMHPFTTILLPRRKHSSVNMKLFFITRLLMTSSYFVSSSFQSWSNSHVHNICGFQKIMA